MKVQAGKGVSKDNVYVVSHDDDRTKRIVDKVNAKEIGVKEEGLKVTLENIFNKKGDELRSEFQEICFSETEAGELEENKTKSGMK